MVFPQNQVLQEQIRKLLDTSLFLDSERKKCILELLSAMTSQEQEELFSLLKSEKNDISEIISNFLAKKGPEGVEILNNGLAKIRRTFLRSSESSSHKKEEQAAEGLLSSLDDPQNF